jgi:hypothetical protein
MSYWQKVNSAVAATLWVCGLLAFGPTGQAAERPNILFIIAPVGVPKGWIRIADAMQ